MNLTISKYIKNIAIAGILCVSVIVNAQVKITHMNGKTAAYDKKGYFYSLPQTHLKVEVVVKRTEKVAGPLAAYAEKYLGVSGIQQNNSTRFEIMDVRMNTYTQADPDQLYFVQIDKKSKADKNLALSINEAGVLIGVNVAVKQDVSFFEDVNMKVKDSKTKNYFSYFSDYNFYKKTDTIVRRISVDTFSIEKYKFNTSLIQKNPEMKAAEIAEKLEKLRNDRYLLLTGFQEVNYGSGIAYMDAELKKMEASYLSLFTGYTKTEYIYNSYTVLPTKEKANKNIPVFRFSEANGLDVSSGTSIYVNIIPNKATKNIKRVLDATPSELDGTYAGFYYRVPEFGEVKLTYKNRELKKSSFLFGQFGEVVQSPSFETVLEFHPNTGGLKQVKLDEMN